ncbi:MAG TPA: ribosome maturation factor RimP [Mycobacteriales bacterium]|jgi:ribosome maturation factor RimP|nr:ribosome maturation factor RimP [Cryptosporangiaceae bacterium]MDQ1678027.1 ribosome maturation factor RimP [Actinomycetota bacterium]HEV7756046.1 ribosome maturation factor RimP [Mycobacteriales bacterium]
MSRGTPAAQRERLIALLGPVVSAAGYDLDTLSVAQAGRRSIVRVVVDGDDGVSLDAIADVSRQVSEVLDADDAVLGSAPYTLEVTSPGVDRPLTLPRHWRRNAGRLVSAQHGGQPLTGRIVEADDARVVLDVDGTRVEAPYADLGSGSVQIEFSRRDPAGSDEATGAEEES